jgi:3-methylfumaryl-CoA hydratase
MALTGDLKIGQRLVRQSAIGTVVEKIGRNGPFSIVNVDHSLTPEGAGWAAVTEQQTYFLAGLPSPDAAPAHKHVAHALQSFGQSKVVTADEVMLFQYSALGFNTHRIHFDREYARSVEGLPDLVVNGGLATLLATEFLRSDLGLALTSLSARHIAPLFVNRPMTIHFQRQVESAGQVLLLDSDGILAAELAVTFDEL